jgi:hypothetical protein
LALIAISLVTSPLTQRLWTWDRYLHGGQDFETGAFLILVTLCLVLVLARSLKSSLESVLASVWRLHMPRDRTDTGNRTSPVAHGAGLPLSRAVLVYNLPLQI